VTPPAGRAVWIEAARPRTLPAAIAPVLVGTAAAERVIAWRAVAALIVSLAIQVGVNYANDYFDGVRGVDTPDRSGPRRAVAAGHATPSGMRLAMLLAFGVAAIAGLVLAIVVGWELLVVGVLCFAAALGYSGGPKPYASSGLGELFVFLFFGLVATTGSTYVQDERLTIVAVLAAIPVGLLAAAILVANNTRDISSDRSAAKMTLAVRLGATRSQTLYRILVLGAFPWLVLIAGRTDTPWPLLPFACLVLVPRLHRGVVSEEPGRLVSVLVGTARLELVFAILLAVGLWLR
jgi:1,4-dihydroxy-2-naphthoate polyprenyltransferase